MAKAIIFDLDGTLLDTRKDLANSINFMLEALNKKKLSQEEIISHVGHGIKYLVEECAKPKNEEDTKEAISLFKKFYSKEYLKNTIPYDGTKDLVIRLKEEGLIIGVNSNKDDIYTKELIKKHYKEIDLKYVLGGKEGIEKKPSPQAVNIILNDMGVRKEDTIYIGDSVVDVDTAKNAGIFSLIVGWGFSKKEDLLKEKGIKLVESPSEILEYIKEMNNA